MANSIDGPIRGEVRFEAAGASYVLAYSINALVAIEDALGMGIADIGALLQDKARVRLGTVRTVFRCGLVDHHPGLTDAQAGMLMTELGVEAATNLIGKALSAVFAPQSGTGLPSSAAPGPGNGAADPLAAPPGQRPA